MRADSTEYLDLTVFAPADTSMGALQYAFDGGAWADAEVVEINGKDRTVVLVGPGGPNVLEVGVHRISVKYSASPEQPVLDAGYLWIEASPAASTA